jgi:hypothetical protein
MSRALELAGPCGMTREVKIGDWPANGWQMDGIVAATPAVW